MCGNYMGMCVGHGECADLHDERGLAWRRRPTRSALPAVHHGRLVVIHTPPVMDKCAEHEMISHVLLILSMLYRHKRVACTSTMSGRGAGCVSAL